MIRWNTSLVDGPIPVPVRGPVATDDDGQPYRPVTGYRSEYHLNVPPQCAGPGLEAYVVQPATPERVFSGGETVFLRFASEAEAAAALPDLIDADE